MGTNGIAGILEAALPSRGNGTDAAQGDEQDRLKSAVPAEIQCAVFTDIIEQQIIPDKGIMYPGGDEFVDLPCLFDICDRIFCKVFRERAEIRGKPDMDMVFGQNVLAPDRSLGTYLCLEQDLQKVGSWGYQVPRRSSVRGDVVLC